MTKPVVGLPTPVLFALPVVSLALLGALVMADAHSTLTPILGLLVLASISAELVVFPAATYAFLRNSQLRSWPQALGLAFLGLKLFILLALFFLVAAAGI
jgi:hypothetical protein